MKLTSQQIETAQVCEDTSTWISRNPGYMMLTIYGALFVVIALVKICGA